MKLIDLTGQTFGRLTVVGRGDKVNIGIRWLCRCSCGIEKLVSRNKLRSGTTQSCGCLARERLVVRNTKHGGSDLPEFESWYGAKKRCTNQRSQRYADYGGRGITMCDRWLHDFAAFLEDVGPKPSPLHELDRYPNNDGNYEPGNVRWATPTEQSLNRRNNVRLDEAEVVHLLQRGMRPKVIGVLFNCSRTPIDQIARRNGLTFPMGGRRVKGQSCSPAQVPR